MGHVKLFIPILLTFILSALILPADLCLSADVPLVLIVHSYERNHVCGQPQADGVVEALKNAGLYPKKVTVKEFYMDTKKTYTSPEAVVERGRRALKEIDALRPQVVVLLDDNAFRVVGLELVDRPGMAVVFCGLNGQPEDYDKQKKFLETREHPGHNVTGVYEKLHLKRALTVIKNTLSNIDKVVGITDYSPTGNAITKQFELESADDLPVKWEVHRVKTFLEYKKLITELNQDASVQAIYPVALTLPTEDGSRVTAPGIFRWTLGHSKKPEIPLNHFFCKLGLFGGASVDFKSMGKHAGIQVVAILEGEPPGNLSIVEAPDYAIVFNLARARELGLFIPEHVLLASDSVFTKIELKDKP